MKALPPIQALSGVKIIDLTQDICWPFCTKLLADYGADVVKVEPLAGDGARRSGPSRTVILIDAGIA